MKRIECRSFAEVLLHASAKTKQYERTMDGFEAVDRLEEVREAGDRLLQMARSGTIPHEDAEVLLNMLIECFTQPQEYRRELNEVKAVLRRYEQ